MDSQKYLVIITLIDGQNFTVPDGTPDRIEASVFAEARFGNESILRSDPIKLTNSNPEFITELAWQLDKRNLHQLRVERKSIKLQVFLQTRERKKPSRHQDDRLTTNGFSLDSSETHKVELIGYTILDLRSAQQREQPKFQWLPLLNPKFRKSSYNRPEIQLAVTLSRLNEDESSLSLPNHEIANETIESDQGESSMDTRLYTTCLDTTMNSEKTEHDEIIDNDIIIRSLDGHLYIYDAKSTDKPTLEDCDEKFRLTITIPFNSGLDLLTNDQQGTYYFSINLFGTIFRTKTFEEFTSLGAKEVEVEVYTTHLSVLATYFELNPNLDIKLHQGSGKSLALATILLNQLCSLDSKCRSIEGIFALQPMLESENELSSSIHPTIGVSVVLEKSQTNSEESQTQILDTSDDHIMMANEHFGADINDYLYKSLQTTHQLTFDDSNAERDKNLSNNGFANELIVEDDNDGPSEDDHHFCFTIDLKKFSYSSSQRLIPTLRELVIRYSYPFFGYKDTITTDASIPINTTSSIIVSGFCEFNFATTTAPLLTALRELPLILDILAFDETRLRDFDNDSNERIVATCVINLAEILDLNEDNIDQLKDEAISKSVSVPIFDLDNEEIGQLQLYLCLKDLGRPTHSFKASIESISDVIGNSGSRQNRATSARPITPDAHKLEAFVNDAKNELDSWKEEFANKLSEEIRRRDNERFRRLYQRIEAKEARRDQEFKKKIEDLNNLERKFKNSLTQVESLERMLANGFEQLKLRKQEALAAAANQANSCPRRGAGIPVPVRSSSLVRGSSEGSSTRIVRRPSGVVSTVVNGINPRARSNSARFNLSKETQEKLANLRKEKAELLKRGCKPSDELIQEINSLIEKLAC